MSRRRHRLRKALALLAVSGLLIYFMLRWFERSQVYYPNRVLDATEAALGRPFEDVFFAARDGVKLNGWFFPGNTNKNYSPPAKRPN